MEEPVAGSERKCPKCSASVLEGERFCTGCGSGVALGEDGVVHVQDPLPSAALVDIHSTAEAKLRTARKWLLAISIITLLSGVVFYAIQKHQVEDEIRTAELETSGIDPADRDAAFQRELGMTWDEAVAHDRGMVNMLFAVNIGLAVLYFVMWLWAKRNALAAAVTAFLLFVTTIVASAVLEPETMKNGIIVKIFFIMALVKAISAGYEARRAGHTV